MHLAFLTPEYPHTKTGHSGGLGTSIKNMAEELVKAGIRVSIFIYSQQEERQFSENGIHFYLIKHRDFKFLGWYRHRKFLEKYIKHIIQKEKIDALEAPDWTGITAFMKFHCPLSIRFHGSDTYFCHLENRPQKKKNFWFEKTAIKNADALISVSKFTAETTRKLFKLQTPISVIPNAVDTDYFKKENTNIQPNTILYFGSIIRKKGVLELAEIFNSIQQQHPESRLIIAGKDVVDIETGTSTKKLFLQKLKPKSIENIIWRGNLSYSEIKEEIAKAAVIVLPSFAEALPMTWLEAMAMEKALVTSNIGWAQEVMIDGKTGYTANPKDHKLYAERIIELLEHPQKAREMGENARKQVLQKFSTEIVTPQNIKFYQNLIS